MTVDMKALAAAALLVGCATSPPARVPMTPQRAAIVAAMHAIIPHVGNCFDRYKQDGRYNVALTMARDGTVIVYPFVFARSGF